MGKLKKFVLCLIILVGLTLLAPLIFFNNQAGVLSLPLAYPNYSLFIHPALNLYLFWASVILFVMLVGAFFAVLFLPKKEKAVIVKEEHGELKIERKSIESYVAANLDRAQFIQQPKIKVRMTKNKIAVTILGRFKAHDGIVPSTELMIVDVKEDIQNLLGIKDRPIDVVVDFIDYAEEKKKKSRVE
ncbi:alkaline shock response membrane anchor protein AmaP [Enterococcus sp. BWR-S5]|uniref:alkaline shock response membrane anchor protein AmaP n=1 Tax=Enterococcus sp. BWR-S5 TaxID=2787714 RepID=UPI0019240D15|nr:alkaline shock response membrane anchor protein AmaP [Enterococcus sp. BWR-S5]MBL1223499.1 alkaline shock response membrane anchor protein AmaP [Enterococcus sp. BWR-S5]